jgi:hypothetical protein
LYCVCLFLVFFIFEVLLFWAGKRTHDGVHGWEEKVRIVVGLFWASGFQNLKATCFQGVCWSRPSPEFQGWDGIVFGLFPASEVEHLQTTRLQTLCRARHLSACQSWGGIVFGFPDSVFENLGGSMLLHSVLVEAPPQISRLGRQGSLERVPFKFALWPI